MIKQDSTYVIRLVTAIFASQVSVVSVLVRVAVLQPAQSLIQGTSAKVKSKVRFCANNFAPLQELIGTKLVAFLTKPSKFWSARMLAFGDILNIWNETHLTGL